MKHIFTLAIVILAVAACGTSQPAATITVTPPAPGTVSTMQALQEWWDGTGGQDYRQTETDLSQAHADYSNPIALAADGTTLADDAMIAADTPPPVSPVAYSIAMGDLATAGDDMTNGDYPGATQELDAFSADVASLVQQLNDMEAANASAS